MSPAVVKVFILDTNVLIHDPNVIDNLGDNTIVIPVSCLEELDKSKKGGDLLGASSREVSRTIDHYCESGFLGDGVPTKKGGTLYVDCSCPDWGDLPVGLEKNNDNRIILVAKTWQGEGREVILLTKDINMRVKASCCGVTVEDYKHDKQVGRIEDLYSGVLNVIINSDAGFILTNIYNDASDKTISLDELLKHSNLDPNTLSPNICVRLIFGKEYALAIYKAIDRKFVAINGPVSKGSDNILPVNDEQAFAYALLNDSSIKLVTLVGMAGTGKTLMSLLAAHKSDLDTLVWRPNVEIGQSLGFLPGDIGEKFAPWCKPILANMRLIIGESNSTYKKGGQKFDTIDEFIQAGVLRIEPINHVQGGTENNTFILIDEAQNLTPREVAMLVTRCGENSKVVIVGDPYQIYNPYLDPTTNGLTHVVQRFRGQEMFGHITMTKGERSELAELAARLLS